MDLRLDRVRTLASLDCTIGNLVPSPDATRAVDTSRCRRGDVTLNVVDLATGRPRVLVHGSWATPSFTSDGRWVVAADLSPTGTAAASRLFRIDVATGRRVRIPVTEPVVWPVVVAADWAAS